MENALPVLNLDYFFLFFFSPGTHPLQPTLQEFADRVRGLAMEAYPYLPSNVTEMEIINGFLMGCSAKEAGFFCLNLKHESLDAATQAVQLCFEKHRAMFWQKKVRRIEVAEHSEDSDSSKISRVQLSRERIDRSCS